MNNIISIQEISKQYASGHQALKTISLDIKEGEILALLGPNGAGKTTLISIICGLVNTSSGKVFVNGMDNVKNYRLVREIIGLVPQEISLPIFETVWNSVCYSRGMHGKKSNKPWIVEVLKMLSLYDKKDSIILELSGGMKRRVLIAKALSHEPTILFLDEPTAGVDVALRKDMWNIVKKLRQTGVTIILTTHYIEEAEAMADRVGVINNGELILIENKTALITKMSKQQLTFTLNMAIKEIPKMLESYNFTLSEDGFSLLCQYNTKKDRYLISNMLNSFTQSQLTIINIQSTQSSLEDIFVNLVKKPKEK